MGLGQRRWETGHPWEQRHSWGHEALGKDTSTPAGYEPFYCRLRAETRSWSRRRRGRATEMRSPQTTEARFSHSETETNLSVCKLPATGHAANPAEGQQPSSSGMEANSAPCVRGGLPGTAWRILGRHSADAAPGTPLPWCNQQGCGENQRVKSKPRGSSGFLRRKDPDLPCWAVNWAPEDSSSLPRPPSHTSDPPRPLSPAAPRASW